MFMKSRIVKLIGLTLCSLMSTVCCWGQAAEAALLAGITANTVAISSEMNSTNALQASIAGENAAITAMLSQIYDYEKTMYDYMSKAQGVVMQAYTISKCIKTGAQIIEELDACREAAKKNPEGVLISSFITNQYTDIIAECAALTGYLTPIVKGGGKNNLLNSAERIKIMNTVMDRLIIILNQVKQMKYNILYMNKNYLLRQISPEFYYNFMKTQTSYDVATGTINDMRRARGH